VGTPHYTVVSRLDDPEQQEERTEEEEANRTFPGFV